MTDQHRTPSKSRRIAPASEPPTGGNPVPVSDESDDDSRYEQQAIKRNSIAEIVGTVVQTALGG